MEMIVRLIIGLCCLMTCLFGGLPSVFAWAPERSLNQLSQSLESLVESSDHLVVANDELTLRTRALHQKADSLRGEKNVLDQSIAQLNEALTVYEHKTKDRKGLVEQNQIKIDDAKARLFKMDQEIEMKKIALTQRQKQQEYIFKILNIVNSGGTVEQNIQTVKRTQTQLVKQMKEGKHRLEDLEAQWKELSFWYGDASLTKPQLTVTRDQLGERLAALKGIGVSENWTSYQGQIKVLNKDIKELTKRHASYVKTLEAIESEYTGKDPTAQLRADEKKLQQTLARLKKENKTLQRQAADLRFEMIDLDKKKSFLDAELAKNNK